MGGQGTGAHRAFGLGACGTKPRIGVESIGGSVRHGLIPVGPFHTGVQIRKTFGTVEFAWNQLRTKHVVWNFFDGRVYANADIP